MYFSFSNFAADPAPVASSLCVQYTHRTVVITGGLLAFSGMALGFFGFNMVWMYATTGFLQGMNLWLSFTNNLFEGASGRSFKIWNLS